MPKYVIGPDVALYLAENSIRVSKKHQLLAPTLFRSQVLSLLYQAAHDRKLTKEEAIQRLEHIRALRIRLLGDRVLQDRAWKLADQLGWPDTLDVEYFALTQLQADAFVTMDKQLATALWGVVRTEEVKELMR